MNRKMYFVVLNQSKFLKPIMLLEYLFEFNKAFIYTPLKNITELNCIKEFLEFEIKGKEIIGDIEVTVIELKDLKNLEFPKNDKGLKLVKIFCKCNFEIKFSTINQLPSDGWEELIDCWSCHNSEFKTMLELKASPRKSGILFSSFYFLMNEEELPKCCFKESRKIFYNEVNIGLSDNQLIFYFFKEYFRNNNTFLFKHQSNNIEIKYFSDSHIFEFRNKNLKILDAMKIGFKKTNKIIKEKNYINTYFLEKIYEMLLQRKLGVYIIGYEISFIVYS